MELYWLNKKENDKLIIFFAGWSFDFRPFEFLDCEDYDVLFVYDYRGLSCISEEKKLILKTSAKYKKSYLIAWSMGVFAAAMLKDFLSNCVLKIAVNGTLSPIDDKFGIPKKAFSLTLKNVQKSLESKFYQNLFSNDDEFLRYSKTPVERSIESRVLELNSLYNVINKHNINLDNFYDKVLISQNDNIILTKNQLNFWTNKAEIVLLDSGHFPYYNFKSWNEILCK